MLEAKAFLRDTSTGIAGGFHTNESAIATGNRYILIRCAEHHRRQCEPKLRSSSHILWARPTREIVVINLFLQNRIERYPGGATISDQAGHTSAVGHGRQTIIYYDTIN